MQEKRPTPAFISSLIAGVIILIDRVFISQETAPAILFFSFLKYDYSNAGFSPSILFLIFGLAAGFIVIMGAINLYFKPERHIVWGIIILVFTILGAPDSRTSLFMLLGIAGAILGILWEPVEAATPPLPLPAQVTLELSGPKKCPRCGRTLLQKDIKNCPYCGLELEQ